MTQGSKTPADVEQEWRKHYLVTGNACGAAKAVGISPSTGYELRDRALDDPEFIKLRDRIRAKLEPDVEQMVVCALQICMERLNNDPMAALEKLLAAAESSKGDGGSARISFQDPGPQYAASMAKLAQSIIAGRRYEGEREGTMRPAGDVRIVVQTTREDLSGEELGDG